MYDLGLWEHFAVTTFNKFMCTPALSVTWTAPLQLRYAACGAIQVLYAFAIKQINKKNLLATDPCADVSCKPTETCMLDDRRNPVCGCGDVCSDDDQQQHQLVTESLAPVCGSDGRTYRSACALRRYVCSSQNQVSIVHRGSCTRPVAGQSTTIARIPPGSSRHVSTRHVRRVEPMRFGPFGCVEVVEQHGSTRSTGLARLDRHARLDALDTSNVSCRFKTWRDERIENWAYVTVHAP